MKIDDSIILRYIEDDVTSYCDHWVFHSIQSGEYLFETPDLGRKEQISLAYKQFLHVAECFIPLNAQLVYQLFPDFNESAADYSIILTVGCPDPYDAMVLEHQGQQYVVIDLLQCSSYLQVQGGASVFSKLLTHEIVHACLHRRYPKPISLQYTDELSYISFDEGFAHALAYRENLISFDFDETLEKRYANVLEKLRKALKEKDIQKQKEYMISADTGNYWEKFASISGKLYILKNKQNIQKIYNCGWKGFIDQILSTG